MRLKVHASSRALPVMPRQNGVDTAGGHRVELPLAKLAELHRVAPVPEVGGGHRQRESREAIAERRVDQRVGWRLKRVQAVQEVLSNPGGGERPAPSALARVEEAAAGAQRWREHLAAARELGGDAIDLGDKVAIAGVAPGETAPDRPARRWANGTVNIDSLVALLSNRSKYAD